LASHRGDFRWALLGSHKRAVLRVLAKPMTPSEICERALKFTPKIRLRDVKSVLRRFWRAGVVYLAEPGQVTGRLYFLTPKGMRFVRRAFGISVPPVAEDVDWSLYSFVVRAYVRRFVVMLMIMPGIQAAWRRSEPQLGWTIAELRRQINTRFSVGFSSVMRAVYQLRDAGVLECVGLTRRGERKLYALSDVGRRVGQEMLG